MILNFKDPLYCDKVDILKDYKYKKVIKRSKNHSNYYFNIPCSFDIETSSFYNNEEKVALMYIWQFGFAEYTFYGRTWDEYLTFLSRLKEIFGINSDNRLIVYVHNLSFEFQFMRKWFDWLHIFAVDDRQVLIAESKLGFEFRCSYLLSGYNLDNLAKNLNHHKINKLVGNLDYSEIRTPLTKITKEELDYCVNDVRIVCAYIQECIEQENNDISKIPYTKTGYVRRYVRDCCFYIDSTHRGEENNIKYRKYQSLINGLYLFTDEYLLLKRAFMGGFTHGNHYHVGEVLDNVASFDFTSSYPAVMMYEKFPMKKGIEIKTEHLTDEMFEFYLKKYCCLITLEITNLKSKLDWEHPLSSSKVWDKEEFLEDNGRIVKLKKGIITVTEVDFKIYRDFYKFDYKVMGMFIYEKGYLPLDFVKAVGKLYQDKTELKGIDSEKVKYQIVKGMLNACYGMCVTDIVRDNIDYIDDWTTTPANVEEQIKKYNRDKKRFLSYPWGVWITAYARRNLFDAIKYLEYDYVYSDTDSVKFLNYEKHKEYFENYNKNLEEKLKQISKTRNIDFNMFNPKNKLIGVWDFEGIYKRFKTLGAKRYLVEKKNKTGFYDYDLTMSGVKSEKALEFMLKQGKPFELFEDGLLIPGDYTGKLTHTYLDEKQSGTIIDCDNNSYNYITFSGVHLEPATFEIGIAQEFENYLLGIVEVRK